MVVASAITHTSTAGKLEEYKAQEIMLFLTSLIDIKSQ